MHFKDVRVVKAIRLGYEASDELSSLFEKFRLMCEDAIRIALKEKPRSKFKLIELAYPRLKEYGLHNHYILSACEVAFSAYKNPRRRSDPCIRKRFIMLDNQSYTLNHLILRIPTKPKRFTLGAEAGKARSQGRTRTSIYRPYIPLIYPQ
jgi:hypothetical protein